jgi:5-methylcytosine-specific restriction endonuclease McrA
MKKILRKKVFSKDKLANWAKKVKFRDRFECKACGYKGYLHSHHILPKSKYPKYRYNINNGITLCYLCHLGKNGVHGKGVPRNKVVRELRKLLKSNCFNSIKKFLDSLS